jgi:hypothetical protein
MNWGDNVLGASALLAKKLIRSIHGPDFDLVIYASGATLVVIDARTAARFKPTISFLFLCLPRCRNFIS